MIVAICIALAFAFDIYVVYTTPDDAPRKKKVCLLKENPAEKEYTSRLHVAKYICDNGQLPSNYITKSEGKRLYEQKTGRNFTKWNFNPLTTLGVMIGGDNFDNREGQLPQGTWYEADVDYFGNNRGTNRLIYSSGCNIYYTGNHYKTFNKIEFGN
ncbi:putative ribonuclease [Fibrobacter succinogenes subsp. succinogenes S85]|uniref:Ribonuclease n=1 Tax=Fibrobacter succinogenes (strain ATCC 19169 / S85) TaxID=59374 RepID=D9S7W8_FIBSS|nr:putative ribonuclease [Fibrobacter succinogenes subsp. succinogenes S85]